MSTKQKKSKHQNPDGVTIPPKSTIKKKQKGYCTKHSLFHGQKYKSCTSTISFKNGSKITFKHAKTKQVGTYKGIPVFSDPDMPQGEIFFGKLTKPKKKFKNKRAKGYLGLIKHLGVEKESFATATIEPPCACFVHLKNDEGKKDTLHCLGHGTGCPCSKPIVESHEKPVDERKEEK